MRSAEQRCPADWNAEASTSRTTCSVSAVESTIIAFSPPVSATSTASGAAFSASARLMIRATSVEPVKTTPAIPGAAVSGPPTAGPSPGSSCSAASGTPASCISAVARAAISGVCSAGFAITAFPAPRQAATCPLKIASGKFQGRDAHHHPARRPVAASAWSA